MFISHASCRNNRRSFSLSILSIISFMGKNLSQILLSPKIKIKMTIIFSVSYTSHESRKTTSHTTSIFLNAWHNMLKIEAQKLRKQNQAFLDLEAKKWFDLLEKYMCGRVRKYLSQTCLAEKNALFLHFQIYHERNVEFWSLASVSGGTAPRSGARKKRHAKQQSDFKC